MESTSPARRVNLPLKLLTTNHLTVSFVFLYKYAFNALQFNLWFNSKAIIMHLIFIYYMYHYGTHILAF